MLPHLMYSRELKTREKFGHTSYDGYSSLLGQVVGDKCITFERNDNYVILLNDSALRCKICP